MTIKDTNLPKSTFRKKKTGTFTDLIAGLLVKPEGIKLKPQCVLFSSQ